MKTGLWMFLKVRQEFYSSSISKSTNKNNSFQEKRQEGKCLVVTSQVLSFKTRLSSYLIISRFPWSNGWKQDKGIVLYVNIVILKHFCKCMKVLIITQTQFNWSVSHWVELTENQLNKWQIHNIWWKINYRYFTNHTLNCWNSMETHGMIHKKLILGQNPGKKNVF